MTAVFEVNIYIYTLTLREGFYICKLYSDKADLFRVFYSNQEFLKVAKMKDANYGCKDEGNYDGVSGQSVISQSVLSQSVVS